MAHKLKDIGRRDANLINRRVEDTLPEYFTAEYPDTVKFLQYYYDFLDSDGVHAFDNEIKQLSAIRDIGETPKDHLDQLIKELGAGLQNGDLFQDARFSTRRFADHYRNKGSRFSIEEFFRAFFQQDVEVVYPKKDIFTIGQDQIGYDSQKFIQDYARYQVFSILIKIGLGVSTYRSLYKKFVHPAGFYFEGEVTTEGEADLSFDNMPLSIASVDLTTIVTEAIEDIVAEPTLTTVTGLIDSEGSNVRVRLDQTVAKYATLTGDELTDRTIEELIGANSPTMDDSDTIVLSTTLQTMDEDLFRRYGSDSAI